MGIKTPVAVDELGTTYHKLISLVRFKKLNPPPQKDSSGDYVWGAEDLARARQALAAGRRKENAGVQAQATAT
jgi:hypothetical protein